MVDQKIDIKSLTPEGLVSFLGGLGKEKFRAGQIQRWVYKRGVVDFAEMTDLAKDFRGELEKRAFISDWEPEHIETSRDGTEKYLFSLEDGAKIETVRIPMDNDRSTICVSTQVGCAMQCEFCLTGQFGLTRDLQTAEIVNQVCGAMKRGSVNNIVFINNGMHYDFHLVKNYVQQMIWACTLFCTYGFACGPLLPLLCHQCPSPIWRPQCLLHLLLMTQNTCM